MVFLVIPIPKSSQNWRLVGSHERRRQWHPTPVLLPGKSHGRRSLVGWVAKSRTRLSDFTFTFHFHALEKEMATHSTVLAWRIPGMEEPDGLPSMGLHRVGHDLNDLAAGSHEGFPGGSDNKESTCSAGIEGDSGSIPGVGRSLEEGLGNPRQYSCLENPMDTGAWWATVHRVTKSQIQLKRHVQSSPETEQCSSLRWYGSASVS